TLLLPGGCATPVHVSARWHELGRLGRSGLEIDLILTWGPGSHLHTVQSAAPGLRDDRWTRIDHDGATYYTAEAPDGSIRLRTETVGTWVEFSTDAPLENLVNAVHPLIPAPTETPRLVTDW